MLRTPMAIETAMMPPSTTPPMMVASVRFSSIQPVVALARSPIVVEH